MTNVIWWDASKGVWDTGLIAAAVENDLWQSPAPLVYREHAKKLAAGAFREDEAR